jgi:hypothetical protein
MKGPLRRRDVRLIVAAVGASAAGDFILWIPLTLHLQGITDSGIAVAALFIALWAPVVVLAPVARMLVDRLEARSLLLVVSLLQAPFTSVSVWSPATAARGDGPLRRNDGGARPGRPDRGKGGTELAMVVNATTFCVVALVALASRRAASRSLRATRPIARATASSTCSATGYSRPCWASCSCRCCS